MKTSCIYLDIKLNNLYISEEDGISVLDQFASKIIDTGLDIFIHNPNNDSLVIDTFPAATFVTDKSILDNYNYIFNITLDKKFNVYDLYALLFNRASLDACLAVLESTDFNFICCHYIRNKNIKDYSVFACTKEYLLHSQPINPFKKPLQANEYPKVDMILNNIKNYNSSDNKIISNNIDSYGIEVSVIIPAFNREKYIEECLNSVINSNFNQNYELIIINDASNDTTEAICKEIIEYINIPAKIISKKNNTHVAHSRNIGIDYAVGKYLFFLDSDNYIKDNCLQVHYDAITADDYISACYAPVQKFTILNDEIKYLDLISNESFDYNKMTKGNYIDTMSMINKKDLISVGKYATWILHFGLGFEDYELWMRMHKLNKNINFINIDPVSYYRVHDSNLITECFEDSSQVGKIVMINY